MRTNSGGGLNIRAGLFRLLLGALERHDMSAVRLIEIRILRDLARRAFGPECAAESSPAVRTRHSMRSSMPERALASYAVFTTACAREYASNALSNGVSRLYGESYRLGSLIRSITGFRERRDTDRLIAYLYRNINIDMSWITETELVVRSCYFSRYYTPDECRIMSDFDSGVIAGILGGRNIIFTERITEGCGRCKACWKGEGYGQ